MKPFSGCSCAVAKSRRAAAPLQHMRAQATLRKRLADNERDSDRHRNRHREFSEQRANHAALEK